MNTTTNPQNVNPVDFSELTHAGQCLDIYLHNDREIYERYTVPAIRYASDLSAFGEGLLTEWLSQDSKSTQINEALQAAARLVRKYDHLTPTAADIEQVKRNYCAYIIECAQYEINNTVNA